MNSELPRRIVVFSVGPWRVGLPLDAVEQVVHAVEVTPMPDAPPYVLGVIDLRGRIVPVLSLRSRLNCPDRELALSDRFILAHAAGRDLAIVADDVLSVEELSPARLTPVEAFAIGTPALQGIAQLEDGLVLVEDLDRLVQALDAEYSAEAASAS